MALKTFKPVTPSLRQLVQVDRTGLWKGKPVKALTEGLSKSGGRNNAGRITVRHRGGGHKRRYRLVDFRRRKLGVGALVERLSTIRTGPPSSRCCATTTASRPTSWRRSV